MWQQGVLREKWSVNEQTTSQKLRHLMNAIVRKFQRQRRNNGVTTVRQRQSTGAVGTRPTAVQSANRHTGVENTKGTARENEKQGTE